MKKILMLLFLVSYSIYAQYQAQNGRLYQFRCVYFVGQNTSAPDNGPYMLYHYWDAGSEGQWGVTGEHYIYNDFGDGGYGDHTSYGDNSNNWQPFCVENPT
jgi:hypothetical protein